MPPRAAGRAFRSDVIAVFPGELDDVEAISGRLEPGTTA
jgi:hypothetical protein